MSIRAHFPITNEITYLNTAACGLISDEVFKAKNEDNAILFNNTPMYQERENDIVTETKTLISEIYNADVDNIAITPNYSLSFNHILDGLDRELEFLCLNDDYPSLLFPIQKRGFKLNTIEITYHVEQDIYDYVERHRPDVLALSITQFLNGIYIKPSFLSKLKNDFPNLLILADATQYLGVEEFNFKDSKIDALVFSCYKWLNAGLGSCIVLLSEELKNKLDSKTIGANSLIDKTKTATRGVGFLEPGHFEINSIVSLQAALKLHYQNIGIDIISKRIHKLSKLAFEKFKALELLDSQSSQRPFHSSIFNLNIDTNRLEFLQKQNIYVSKRGNGLRISFHYYNSQEDLAHFLRTI